MPYLRARLDENVWMWRKWLWKEQERKEKKGKDTWEKGKKKREKCKEGKNIGFFPIVFHRSQTVAPLRHVCSSCPSIRCCSNVFAWQHLSPTLSVVICCIMRVKSLGCIPRSHVDF